jgi:hypothetical protein
MSPPAQAVIEKTGANETEPLPFTQTNQSARTSLTPSTSDSVHALEALLLTTHDAFAARDSRQLGATLEELLINSDVALLLIDGLKTQRWGRADEALTPSEDGARIAIGAGVALYSSAHSPAATDFGERFITALLESLPLMRPLLAPCIAEELARAEVNDAPVLNAPWLPLILQLRWAHPESRHIYDLLLQALLGSEEADSAVIARLLFSGEEDPGLLRVALLRLLKDDPAHWFGVASEWYERADSIPMRAAIASAVAAAAPTRDAARFLAQAASPLLHAQAASLAARDGGMDSLSHEYEARLSAGDDPSARRALVSGLARDSDLCLGIARTDPDRSVRGQALLSATVRSSSREALDVIEAAWQAADDERYGVAPRHLVWSAANAVSRVEPELRTAAVGLLRSLASDPALPHEVRADACARLRRWLPTHEHSALTALLSSMNATQDTQEPR